MNNSYLLLIGAPKYRPASMDLLMLQNHHSNFDIHPVTSSCQVRRIPPGTESEERDHLYRDDEGLYERVGVMKAPPPAPAVNSAQSQAITEVGEEGGGGGEVESKGPNEAGQAEMMVEYACVKKVRKLEKGKRQDGSEEENASNSTVHRKTTEPFHKPNFPKVNIQMQSAKSQVDIGLFLTFGIGMFTVAKKDLGSV